MHLIKAGEAWRAFSISRTFLSLLLGLNSHVERAELQEPGGSVRVAVGKSGRRSSIWTILFLIPKNKDEVYVMAIPIALAKVRGAARSLAMASTLSRAASSWCL